MSSPASSATMTRYCVRCGNDGPFRSERAFLCNPCVEEREEEERAKANRYFQARNRAMKRLREEFAARWEELLADERRKEDARRRKAERAAATG